MQLITRNLFIDTQYFVSKAFNFSSLELQALLNLAKANQIAIYMVDITKSEISQKINDFAVTAYKKIDTSDLLILKNIPLYRKFLKTYDLSRFQCYMHAEFERFLKDANIQTISVDIVQVSRVFRKYFSQSPPFNSTRAKDRRHEFPDAFTLEAILAWSEKEKKKCYLLSGDSDWENFCRANSSLFGDYVFLHPLTDLNVFMNSIIENDTALQEKRSFAERVIQINSEVIKKSLIGELRETQFLFDVAPSVAEIVNKKIDKCDYKSHEIIEIGDSGFVVHINFTCESEILFESGELQATENAFRYPFGRKDRSIQPATFNVSAAFRIVTVDNLCSNISIYNVEIENPLFIKFEKDKSLPLGEWLKTRPIIIVGVCKGKITDDASGAEEFSNIEQAKKVYPTIDTASSADFTGVIGSVLDVPLRIETWKAYAFYSS